MSRNFFLLRRVISHPSLVYHQYYCELYDGLLLIRSETRCEGLSSMFKNIFASYDIESCSSFLSSSRKSRSVLFSCYCKSLGMSFGRRVLLVSLRFTSRFQPLEGGLSLTQFIDSQDYNGLSLDSRDFYNLGSGYRSFGYYISFSLSKDSDSSNESLSSLYALTENFICSRSNSDLDFTVCITALRTLSYLMIDVTEISFINFLKELLQAQLLRSRKQKQFILRKLFSITLQPLHCKSFFSATQV